MEEILKIRSRVRPNPSDIRKALQSQVGRIKERTESGVDFEGREFAAYSEKYRKRKERRLGSAHPVNLRWSGSMLNGMRASTTGDRIGRIGFKGASDAEKAFAHASGSGNNLPVRDFLSTTQEELDLIAEEIYQNKRKREGN